MEEAQKKERKKKSKVLGFFFLPHLCKTQGPALSLPWGWYRAGGRGGS